MNKLDRRQLLGAAVGLGAAALTHWQPRNAAGADGSTERIKIGQIGVGHEHGEAKMATLRKLPEHYDVAGVVEPNPELRKKFENHPSYRGLKWMTEEELFNTKGLKAVAVETDVPDLVPTAARCIDAGMHIHLDKPGGETIEPFKKLLDDAGRQGLAVQLGYMYRNNPAIQFCFRAVRQGWLGNVFEVHAVMSRFHSVEYRKYLSQFRGGAMYIFGCHLMDLAVSLLGKPDRVAPFLRRTRDDVNVYDNGLVVLEYPRATATVRTASLEVEGYRRRQLVVCGDRGTIDIRPLETYDVHPAPPLKLQLVLSESCDAYKKGSQEVLIPSPADRYEGQLVELAWIIRGEIANPYPLAHELLVQEVLLAAIDGPTKSSLASTQAGLSEGTI